MSQQNRIGNRYAAQKSFHHGAKPSTFKNANELRRRSTEAEKKLWTLLRNRNLLGVKFRRQHPIVNYVLDFYCHEHKLAIEADGIYHTTPEGREYDSARTAVLQERGITILRFWNSEIIMHPDNVLQKISSWINRAST